MTQDLIIDENLPENSFYVAEENYGMIESKKESHY
jgi:hypothetical protein